MGGCKEKQQCGACRWYAVENHYSGQCRRHAPVVDPQAITGYSSESYTRGPRIFWPITRVNNFCGDWELAADYVDHSLTPRTKP